MKVIKVLYAICVFSPVIAYSMSAEDVLYKACSDGAMEYSKLGLSAANKLRALSTSNLKTDEIQKRIALQREELFALKNQKFKELHAKRDELAKILGSQTNVEGYIYISTDAIMSSFIQSMETGEVDELKLFVKVNKLCIEEYRKHIK